MTVNKKKTVKIDSEKTPTVIEIKENSQQGIRKSHCDRKSRILLDL
jgi:hypothetical protein